MIRLCLMNDLEQERKEAWIKDFSIKNKEPHSGLLVDRGYPNPVFMDILIPYIAKGKENGYHKKAVVALAFFVCY